MKNIILYGHGGSGNHGCEAIVKGIQKILSVKNVRTKYILSTLDWTADKKFILSIDEYIKNSFIAPKSLQYYVSVFSSKVLKMPEVSAKIMYKNFFKAVKKINKNSLFLSIGGDNYCCKNPVWLYLHNHSIDKLGADRVLWGCSIENEVINEKMIKDLSGYSLIIARESITYNSLKKKKIKSEIKLHSDPAFVLDADISKIPDNLKNEKTIGINLSPLILKSGKEKNIVYKNYFHLVKYILKTTEYNIIFIPHVLVAGNNDYNAMKPLYEAFKGSNRVVMIINNLYNASQYKGIISQCCMFIGARTHSTIAAYSTCVPTLALGYSVKAKGIARDIFGNEKGLVLPVQNLENENQLIYAFEGLRERENELRDHLKKTMPKYIESAWVAGELIKKLLEG